MRLLQKTLILVLTLLCETSSAIDPILIKGSKFFYSNGTQFYIKGVAYQQSPEESNTYIDPLSDVTLCRRDIPILTALKTNTIRTYAIDPRVDHSECMALLAAAGIYVISDLGEPSLSINRDSPSWNIALFERYKAVVDEMGRYPNVIGFFAGNEVTNSVYNTGASAYVKAAVRDTKAYIKSKMATSGGRWMGVGYAANDDKEVRISIAQYFNCGKEEDAIDFWGYNIYSWCGNSTFRRSGYADQIAFFSNYSVPTFFAEYGCNTVGGAEGRTWDETRALYSDEMTGVMSGGIVYEYFENVNDYGLVNITGTKNITTRKNYDTLKSVMATINPTTIALSAYNPISAPQACPSLNFTWNANQRLPPSPNTTVCNCMYDLLTCLPVPTLPLASYASLFSTACTKDPKYCAGIAGNTTTGNYGAFSMCNDTQKLGYVLDMYYRSQGSAASACDFHGQAVRATPAASAATGTCSAVVASAQAAAASGNSGARMLAPRVAVGVYALVAAGVGVGVGVMML